VVTLVPRWSGREARALREAKRMSVREFAAHLGVNDAAVSSWERRGELARLRYQTQQILDVDLARSDADVRDRFELLLLMSKGADSGTAGLGNGKPTDVPGQPVQNGPRQHSAFGFPSGQGPAHAGVLGQESARLRHRMDMLVAQAPATAACLDSFDERVDLHARDCVRLPPLVMVDRLLSDFGEVELLASHRHQPRAMLRLYAVAAGLASLIADEMMVLGLPADSQAWHTTAKAAADVVGDPTLQARTRSLNALLYLYYGDPARTVVLAQEAQAFASKPTAATALAAAVEAFAYSRIGDRDSCRTALEVAADQFYGQQEVTRDAQSVFGFSERRWLFYRSRALLRVGTDAEARRAAAEAIACYPPDVVGDPTVVKLDLARRLASSGDPLDAAGLAAAVLTELPPEHRTGLFLAAGRDVLASMPALGRDHQAVRELKALVLHESPASAALTR